MRKSMVLLGLVLFVVGIALGFYASQRNCLIAFVTSGYMSFWTAIEILGGIVALAGVIIVTVALIKKI
jgi:hypothetical protein